MMKKEKKKIRAKKVVQKGITSRYSRKYACGIYDTSAIFYYVRQSTYRAKFMWLGRRKEQVDWTKGRQQYTRSEKNSQRFFFTPKKKLNRKKNEAKTKTKEKKKKKQ